MKDKNNVSMRKTREKLRWRAQQKGEMMQERKITNKKKNEKRAATFERLFQSVANDVHK